MKKYHTKMGRRRQVSKAEKNPVILELLRRRQPRNNHSNSNKKTPPPFLPEKVGPTTRSITGVGLGHCLCFRCRLCRLRGWDNVMCGRLLRQLGGGWVRRLPSCRLTHIGQVTHRWGAILRESLFELALLNVPGMALASPGPFVDIGRVHRPGCDFIR